MYVYFRNLYKGLILNNRIQVDNNMKDRMCQQGRTAPTKMTYLIISISILLAVFSALLNDVTQSCKAIFMPWADSPYNTETVLETLETEGKQGNKVELLDQKFSYAMPESKKKIVLEDTKTVATYSPLSHIFPAFGDTVNAVESSVQIVWTGGPQPWPLDPSNHFRTLTKDQENIVRVSTVKEGGGVYVYKAVCLTLGETSVTLSVGNKASSTLPKPEVSTSTVKIICGTPASIHLTPEINGPTGLPPCPASARAGLIATQAYRNLDIGVTIKDGQGRIFDGVESVTLDWKLSDNGLAKLGSSSGVLRTKQVFIVFLIINSTIMECYVIEKCINNLEFFLTSIFETKYPRLTG